VHHAACARIAGPILVVQQGDGITGFREIMIRQNENEPRRKLLETRLVHFVCVSSTRRSELFGFDMQDKDSAHLFQWRPGRRPQFYGVANVGKGFHNRDEVYLNGPFDCSGCGGRIENKRWQYF